jgi:hypothetical protein
MARQLRSARLAVLVALALAGGCGDDGSDDTAAGTTTAPTTDASTGGSATTEPAESTGPPAECEAVACGEGELCIVPGDCTPDAPYCAPAEMVICDFASGVCTLEGVCSGTLGFGALVCETCA